MKFIQHPSNTRALGAPPGVPIEECRALPVTDMVVDGTQCVASFWKPDAEELRALNAGKCVVVVLQGRTHAPLFASVEIE